MMLSIGEPLSADIIELVEFVTSRLGEASRAVSAQSRAATVTSYSSTNIDVTVPAHVPAIGLPNGPTPGRAIVYVDGVVASEVMVWIRDGCLIGLEQPWYTEDTPDSWPRPEAVELEP